MCNSIVNTHLSVIIRLGFNRSHQIKVTLNIYITFPMRIPYHNLHCFLESEHRSFTASRMCQNFRWPASPVRRTTDGITMFSELFSWFLPPPLPENLLPFSLPFDCPPPWVCSRDSDEGNTPIQPLLLANISHAVILMALRMIMSWLCSNCSLESSHFQLLFGFATIINIQMSSLGNSVFSRNCFIFVY